MPTVDDLLNGTVVHVLFEGRPLCGFFMGTPKNWPPNYQWTYIEDVKEVTCPECRLKSMKIAEGEPDTDADPEN